MLSLDIFFLEKIYHLMFAGSKYRDYDSGCMHDVWVGGDEEQFLQ